MKVLQRAKQHQKALSGDLKKFWSGKKIVRKNNKNACYIYRHKKTAKRGGNAFLRGLSKALWTTKSTADYHPNHLSYPRFVVESLNSR